MHLPGGVLDNLTCAVTTAAATGAIGYSGYRLRREATAPAAPKMAACGALVFAAQMVNFPVDQGVSGHLIGGLLAAALLGPWAGLLAVAMVLSLQSLLAADGGVVTLGANIINMGVVTVWGGYWMLQQSRRLFAVDTAVGRSASASLAAAVSVVAAATVCALQLSLSGAGSAAVALAEVVPVHLRIGLAEAIVSGALVALAAVAIPGMLYGGELRDVAASGRSRLGRGPAVVLALALALTLFVAPWASAEPDGLEAALASLIPGQVAPPVVIAPLADYQVPGVTHAAFSTALAGALGALAVYVAVWTAGRALRLRPVAARR